MDASHLKRSQVALPKYCGLVLLLGVAIAGVFLRAIENIKIKNTGESSLLAAFASISDIKYIKVKASV